MKIKLPRWLHRLIKTWGKRLHIEPSVRASVGPLSDSEQARCVQYADLNSVELIFRLDVEDTHEWKVIVIHELIHAAHIRVDKLIEDAVIAALPESARQLARDTYSHAVESFVQRLAEALAEWR